MKRLGRIALLVVVYYAGTFYGRRIQRWANRRAYRKALVNGLES